jgi:hypothetical protein
MQMIFNKLKQKKELEEQVKELEAEEEADPNEIHRIREILKTIDVYVTQMMECVDRME